MLILAIETSCDETACAIVENGTKVLANEIASSLKLHKKTGGIVPEVAARDAARKILPVIKSALKKAKLSWVDIDALAVTNGPGLAGSLMVGIETARTLAYVHQKPLIPVQHIMGHVYSNALEREQIVFPSLVLTVSGGHNNLLLWRDFLDFEVLGETLDDSAGEAFDKVAKMLDLGFPGGPEISRLAEKGNKEAYKFPRPMAQSNDFNFSFSGLKTAVLYTLRDNPDYQTEDVCASFQEAVVDALLIKLKKAMSKFHAQAVYLAGGVSANERLCEKVGELCQKQKTDFFVPVKKVYSTDNAAMIASAAYFIAQKKPQNKWNFLDVQLNLSHELS